MDPIELVEGALTKEDIWKQIESINEDAVLVCSSDKPENVKKAQEAGMEKVSEMLEQTTAYIAKNAEKSGANRIILAGGETSGAVTRILGYDSYLVGESIAPGVPVMVPLKNKDLRLVLISGNFGQEDFFLRAVDITKDDTNV
ncbi:uncharacterized protein YgbK (DUF1537 family) [Salirhabdus euzebyi]|uniref:Uncharacterized protein YgbK (DUF1537 family) n=2 Tax=Salirhabdus euzebyi TaxID=394506 RepID=A0A841Q8B8_9BACI|nr:uncharacterized protein YgbK (DUF1537 family) [Salirhabdus euzebyi]